MSTINKYKIVLIFLVFYLTKINCQFLRVSDKDFYYGNQKVFLSGVNFAWYWYGYDFGNGNYEETAPVLETWIKDVAAAGGNSIRLWLHVEGESTPNFESNGFVNAPDRDGKIISDLSKFLDVAQEHNVFIIIVLWNGALFRIQNHINLVWDDAKLYSYIQNSLIPMVAALKNKPALGAWEIINEIEGGVLVESNSNPCFDTERLRDRVGWTDANIPMRLLLRFINWQSSAIHQEDPKALVTSGSWNERSQTDGFGPETYNYYSDMCLIEAGNLIDGLLDFYQMHTYSWEGNWDSFSSFKHSVESYNHDRPTVIGEFSADCSEGETIEYLFSHAYNNSYDGVWSWQYNAGGHCSDSKDTQDRGMSFIRDFSFNGIIPVIIN